MLSSMFKPRSHSCDTKVFGGGVTEGNPRVTQVINVDYLWNYMPSESK